jgi:plastocyanin
MTRRLVTLMLAVAALALAVSACGGDDDEEDAEEPAAADTTTAEATTEETGGGGGGGTTLELAADPGGALAFDKTTLEAPAGDVTIHLVNEASIPHNVEVEGDGVEEVSETITGGETDLTVTLEPGEYEFYCAVPGHREGGMEGTLTVE